MKFKSLQINVLALLFGFSAICFVGKADANNANKSPKGQQVFDQNGDNFTKQKPTKRGGAATLNWTFRGPDDISGKITSVVSSATDWKTVYVGAAHNGVWKSTTAGAGVNCWKKIPVENNKNLYVTCLAWDETSKVLYAGTGGDFTGQGIYKSENDGEFKLMAGTENWTNVSKIVLSGNKIYAATSAGLMCYTDGTWKVCTGTKSDVPVELNGNIKDLSVNKAGLVMVTMNKVECYISKTGTSDGFEYKALPGITMYNSDNVAITTSPADNNVLYAVAVRITDGKLSKAFLSEDQGETWEIILEWFSGSSFIDPLEGNGFNTNNIYADPIDAHRLYIASKNIWTGKRYAPGLYDFGLSAITISDLPCKYPLYMHSNVRSIDFIDAYENIERSAYIATDGGIYVAKMYILPSIHLTEPTVLQKFLPICSYDYMSANNRGWFLMGSPTLNTQTMGDPLTNYEVSARPLWNLGIGEQNPILEGSGGPCVTSLINDDYYVYSLLGETLTFRRSIDYGESFQPMEGGAAVEWFDSKMPKPKYNAPIIMWENFSDENTFDTVWFKANKNTNFDEGDRTIYAKSKNSEYPIEYLTPYQLNDGDSIQVLDPVQNRMFVGLSNKIWMTREALNYEKTPIDWFLIATLETNDNALALAVSDDANTLYIGTSMGNVHCVTGLKGVYNDSTLELIEEPIKYTFADKKIRAIAVDPTDANHAVLVLEDGGDNVYETTNGMSESPAYNLIKGNLPNNVYSVLLPKGAKKGTIMLGTEKGIWVKESDSPDWVANTNGMGEVPVMALTQMTTYRPGVKNVPYFDPDPQIGKIRINYPNNDKNYLTVYAGTYGSGIFSTNEYVGIPDIPGGPTSGTETLTVVPNPVKDFATIELDMTKGHATIQVFNVEGRCIKEQTAKNDKNTINFKDYAPGTYIIQVIQGGSVKSAKVIKK